MVVVVTPGCVSVTRVQAGSCRRCEKDPVLCFLFLFLSLCRWLQDQAQPRSTSWLSIRDAAATAATATMAATGSLQMSDSAFPLTLDQS